MKLCLLWSNILLRSRNSFHYNFLRTKPKVRKFNKRKRLPRYILSLEEYIFGFEVSMSDSMIMKFLDTLANLQHTLKTLFFSKLVPLA